MKKGQAAIEFILTYGWAFLTILVILGALTYFDVFNTDRFAFDHCEVSQDFRCDEFAIRVTAPDLKSNQITQLGGTGGKRLDFVIQNAVGEPIVIFDEFLITTSGISKTEFCEDWYTDCNEYYMTFADCSVMGTYGPSPSGEHYFYFTDANFDFAKQELQATQTYSQCDVGPIIPSGGKIALAVQLSNAYDYSHQATFKENERATVELTFKYRKATGELWQTATITFSGKVQ